MIVREPSRIEPLAGRLDLDEAGERVADRDGVVWSRGQVRQRRLADELDGVLVMPRQDGQLQDEGFERRPKLVFRCARNGHIGELALGRFAEFRNDLCKFGHVRPRDRMGV
ncbi:MAG: hypothetical protein C0511_14800 [Hyphomicrobium sp.]|nr:hypothetical protein [Hyphomicrobium sp.]PPC80313.1 MAG: hypothetical protein CTY40_09425 [Hyphomicrobium sp.]